MEDLKHKYRYAVLRYVPDFATDEFMNAGILFYDATTNSIKTKLIQDTERLKFFAPKSDYQFFLKYAKMLAEEMSFLWRSIAHWNPAIALEIAPPISGRLPGGFLRTPIS